MISFRFFPSAWRLVTCSLVGHRSNGQGQPSPNGAASSVSHVPAARPQPGRATVRRYSPATSAISTSAANILDPFAM